MQAQMKESVSHPICHVLCEIVLRLLFVCKVRMQTKCVSPPATLHVQTCCCTNYHMCTVPPFVLCCLYWADCVVLFVLFWADGTGLVVLDWLCWTGCVVIVLVVQG